jgi:ribosome-binding protein aMBF1 (putative translation factor)
MTETAASVRGHFATMLSGAMDELDISSRELSKQVGISCEHVQELQAGKALPSELLVEKIATAVGLPLEGLQNAVQRDRLHKTSGTQ